MSLDARHSIRCWKTRRPNRTRDKWSSAPAKAGRQAGKFHVTEFGGIPVVPWLGRATEGIGCRGLDWSCGADRGAPASGGRGDRRARFPARHREPEVSLLSQSLDSHAPEGLGRIAFQQFIELGRPPPLLRPRLNVMLLLERFPPRPQDLAHRVPGHLQIPGNLPDRLSLDEVLAPNPANRLHCQHSPHHLLRIKASSASGLIARRVTGHAMGRTVFPLRAPPGRPIGK
jgi:hypothetical protein